MARKKIEPKQLDVESAVNKTSVANHLFDNDMEQRATISLDEIKNRTVDTRPTNDDHVASLSESIAALGLIEPIVIDENGCLLAGAHRLASIRLLKEKNEKAYHEHFADNMIPVRIMPFDAEKDPKRALQCEVAENEHRRDYTSKEVRELAERLKSAGFMATRGRPQKDEKALMPALQAIVGKSRRTLTRYLAEDENKLNEPNGAFNSKQVVVRKLKKDLEKVVNAEISEVDSPKVQALNKQLPKFMKLVEAALKELEVEG